MEIQRSIVRVKKMPCSKILRKVYQGIELKFVSDKSTYKPDKFTRLIANAIEVKKGDYVCDVGTGSGALAIVSSKLGAKEVYGLDIMDGFRNAFEENCALNNVKDVSFIKSNLFSNFNCKVDVIIANIAQTPFYKPISPSKWGGKDGADKVIRLIKSSKENLRPKGKLFLGMVSLINLSRVIPLLKKNYNITLISQMKRYFTKESSERWKKGFHNYLLDQLRKGQSKFYKDGNEFFYNFYLYECIPKTLI